MELLPTAGAVPAGKVNLVFFSDRRSVADATATARANEQSRPAGSLHPFRRAPRICLIITFFGHTSARRARVRHLRRPHVRRRIPHEPAAGA